MKFHTTSLAGVWLIELEPRQDERGFLARTYCEREFAEHKLNTRWPQCNLTLSRHRGMIRGLHYQIEPHPEIKLVCCQAGTIWDVIVDVRAGAPTYGRWEAFELSGQALRQLYVPAGCAHGFQCLTDNCEVFYQMSDFYQADLQRGLRWNDPTVAIPWPVSPAELSERDRNLPLLLRS
jgi:dTDP-4-dehydrorhamnose 3,5-epimerase